MPAVTRAESLPGPATAPTTYPHRQRPKDRFLDGLPAREHRNKNDVRLGHNRWKLPLELVVRFHSERNPQTRMLTIDRVSLFR
jgi:hypothetical protein